MGKPLLLAAVVMTLLLLGSYADWGTIAQHINFRAFILVTIYAGLLVLARYSPGKCLYRILVLRSPERFYASEVNKAVDFASYVGTRLLFAGLIFTLADIARVLAGGGDIIDMSSALVTTLSAALYALVLYLVVGRALALSTPPAPMPEPETR
jgi:hypothetical protein